MSPKKYPETSMVEKTQVQVENQDSDSSVARKVVGTGFAIIGFILILGVIILNFVNNLEPKVDTNLNTPKLDKVSEYTNKDKVVVSGSVDGVDSVIVFVNGAMQKGTVEVKDGRFSYDYTVEDEGEYVFEAASVAGFPIRKMSAKSESVKVIVDWTSPSADVTLDYPTEVENGLLTVTGKVESNITVRLLGDGEKVYSTESDANGNFKIENIKLVQGENIFRVELEDKAGNKNVLARKIKVTSSVNAPEEKENIPEAGGVVEDALNALKDNNLLTVFGVMTLVILLINGGIVVTKLKRESL